MGNLDSGLISNSYATGSVSGNDSKVGGLVGKLATTSATATRRVRFLEEAKMLAALSDVSYRSTSATATRRVRFLEVGNQCWRPCWLEPGQRNISDSYATGSVFGTEAILLVDLLVLSSESHQRQLRDRFGFRG